jgi:hypothetical protein
MRIELSTLSRIFGGPAGLTLSLTPWPLPGRPSTSPDYNHPSGSPRASGTSVLVVRGGTAMSRVSTLFHGPFTRRVIQEEI